MKKCMLGGVLFLFLIAGAAQARVTGVVLYPGSATVERSGRVSAGSGRLEMTGLPAGFDVQFSYCERIARSPTGKFEDFVSELR